MVERYTCPISLDAQRGVKIVPSERFTKAMVRIVELDPSVFSTYGKVDHGRRDLVDRTGHSVSIFHHCGASFLAK